MNRSGKIGTYFLILIIGLILGGMLGGEVIRRVFREDPQSDASHTERPDPENVNSESSLQQLQDDILNTRRNAIVLAAQRVEKSVVSIIVTQVQYIGSTYHYEDFFDMFFMPKMVPKYREVQNMGSGFILDKDGLILTNNHVVDGAKKLYINFPDGRQLEGAIVGQDPYSDLAVVSVKDKKGSFSNVALGNSDDLMIGEWVIAIGNPFLNFYDAKPTVTVGVVSALNRNFAPGDNVYYQNMIQTDAAINPGNSGGPLLNALGEVIGINSFVYMGTKKAKRDPAGMGFAIPINRAKRVVHELVTYGKRRQVWTGISVQDIDRSMALALGLGEMSGVIVADLSKNDPGDKAGLKVNDVITSMGNRIIRSHMDFEGLFVNYFPGDMVPVTVVRGGETITLSLTLEEYRGK